MDEHAAWLIPSPATLHLFGFDVSAWTLLGRGPVVLLMLALFASGRRRGWSFRGAVLATAALIAGLSAGTALLPSVVGALAGGLLGWLVAQRALGLHRPPLTTLAIGAACLIAVGRFGCLLNGCCFGAPTDLPWAVAYPAGTPAWLLHRAMGWVPGAASQSLGVHPYPLYESLGLTAWIVVALRLRHGLSERTLFVSTAAVDLGLRAIIDGDRAMLNVWWATAPGLFGLDLFRTVLTFASVLLFEIAYFIEVGARRTASTPSGREAPGASAPWGVFVGACLVGALTDAAQTPLLHELLLLSLLAAIPVLPRPAWLRDVGRTSVHRATALERVLEPVPAGALALALVAPIALALERAIADDPGAAAGDADRSWIYEVDRRRGAVIRLGSARDSAEHLAARRLALRLPGADDASSKDTASEMIRYSTTATVPGNPPPSTTGEEAARVHRRARVWLGAEGLLGHARYTRNNGCGGGSTTYDLTSGGFGARAEVELPLGDRGSVWLGGRGGVLFESYESTSGQFGRNGRSFEAGQLWVDLEHPNFTLGGGAWVGAGFEDHLQLLPSLHLRLGASVVGLEAGLVDRAAPFGRTGRLVVSGRVGAREELSYFGGALGYPTTEHLVALPVAGLEYELQSDLLLGGFIGASSEGVIGGASVRTTLGPAE